jgi:signal transduction histidine kinase
MPREMGRRIAQVGMAIALTATAALGLVLFILTVTGFATSVVSVGALLLVLCLPGLRAFARLHRRWAGWQLGRPVASPYRPVSGSNVVTRGWCQLKDPATWRDLLWLSINSTIGLALFIVAIVESVLDLLFWWLPDHLALKANAYIAEALLGPGRKSELAVRVQELTESRAETVDSQASEIRRIERDLHDGAQARLVVLGLNLGLAEELMERDPDMARTLIAEAREASSEALTELRDLVRGIHPPVLADRGLSGAAQALALAAPLPVEVQMGLTGRLPAPVESAGYFAVAEALTNVIKHSGASRAWIALEHADELLRIEVGDDGVGGADGALGTGLRGIERRLSAFDGRLTVISPVGGPTTVLMEVPCASSSPKTLRSSETA